MSNVKANKSNPPLKRIVRRFWRWIKRKLDLWHIDELKIGAHCGLCGKWVENEIIPKEWPITVCDECKNA